MVGGASQARGFESSRRCVLASVGGAVSGTIRERRYREREGGGEFIANGEGRCVPGPHGELFTR